MLPTEAGPRLLGLARGAIATALGQPSCEQNPTESWLHERAACFVTLTQNGQLRGCIGSLQAHRSLLHDVQSNAVAAALHDPRFPPLGAKDLESVCVEVSVLSPPEAISVQSEAQLLACLRPGVDGVVMQFGAHRSTFLPQVWEQLPQPTVFLAQLKRKAGLPADFWDDAMQWQRYAVQKWSEAPLPLR